MKIMQDKRVYIVWLAIFAVWSIYRAFFRFPEAVDELIVKPLIFVAPVLYFVLLVEKSTLESIGLTTRNLFREIYLGLGIGVFFALEGLLVNLVKYGTFSFLPIQAVASVGLMPFLLFTLFTSVSEEILGRGFVYSRIAASEKNQFKAIIIASFLFLLLHIPILFAQLNLTGGSLVVYLVSIFILGVTNSYMFSLRKSLVIPILIHIFWNATVALYL